MKPETVVDIRSPPFRSAGIAGLGLWAEGATPGHRRQLNSAAGTPPVTGPVSTISTHRSSRAGANVTCYGTSPGAGSHS